MYEPDIIFHAPDEIWKIVYATLSQNMPSEFYFTLPDKTSRRIKLRPKLLRTDDPPHFKTISCAPPTFVYLFTCASKSDYTNSVHDQIVKYFQQFEKKFNTILPVFVNDLSRKGIFGGTAAIETAIRANYPNLQVLTIEKNSNISTTNIHNLWDSIILHTHQAITSRLKILNDLLLAPQNKRSIETERHFLRLIYIFNSLTLFDLQEQTTKRAITEIETHPQYFTEFIKSNEILKPVDAYNFSEYQESNLTRELPSEYAMRQAFLRLQIHRGLTSKGESTTVEYAWNFYVFLSNNVNKIPITDEFTSARIIAWLTEFLREMSYICLKKGPVKRFYTFILNAYINELDHLMSLGDFTNLQDFQVVSIVREASSFETEKNRLMKALFDTYLKLNLRRYALCMVSRLSDADIANIDFSLLINTPTRGFTQYAPVLRLEHLKKMTTEAKIRLGARVLCDCSGSKGKNKSYAAFGASIFNEIFGGPEPQPAFIPTVLHLPFYVKANLPVTFRRRSSTLPPAAMRRSSGSSRRESDGSYLGELEDMLDEEKQNAFTGFVVNQAVEIEFEFFCDFGDNVSFTVNKLKVALSDQNKNITYFEASNVIVKNKGRFKAKGIFKRPNPVFPTYIIFGNDLTLPLPSVIQVIHVKKSPPPFKFAMKLPELLLPGLWQKATINVDVLTHLKTLDIIINGLSHKGEVLMLQPNRKNSTSEGGDMTSYLNFIGEKRKASELGEGLSYSDIPIGRHQLNFQILAKKSNELKVQISSENHRVKKSTKFIVSEYLDLKLVYRKATKAAQLVAVSKQPCNITLTNVDFYDENENNRIICTPFGLPAKIEQVKTSVFFLLDDKPDTADVWLQQDGLASFNLNLKVEQMDENQLNNSEPPTQIPMTPLIPIQYEFKY